jgi:hypothetical protein
MKKVVSVLVILEVLWIHRPGKYYRGNIMMKYLLLCMMLGMVVPCMVFSQDQEASEPQNSQTTFVLPPMVMGYDIQRVDLLRQSSFFMLDGRYLKYEEMESLLLTVPENEKYLRRAKGWEISMWVNTGISVGTLAAVLVINLIPDIPNKELWDTAICSAALVEAAVSLYSSRARFDNMQRAIKNYNISIMGVPVSVR